MSLFGCSVSCFFSWSACSLVSIIKNYLFCQYICKAFALGICTSEIFGWKVPSCFPNINNSQTPFSNNTSSWTLWVSERSCLFMSSWDHENQSINQSVPRRHLTYVKPQTPSLHWIFCPSFCFHLLPQFQSILPTPKFQIFSPPSTCWNPVPVGRGLLHVPTTVLPISAIKGAFSMA